MAGKAVLVLGGGLQGRAVLEDLERRSDVEKIVAADRDLAAIEAWIRKIGAKRIVALALDATDARALREALASGVDVVVDMLPVWFAEPIARAAIEAGVHMVNTNYAHSMRGLDGEARSRGVTIMPEAGFDPGIDLVIAGHAASLFDEIEVLLSYGGGLPEPACKDANAINYKISWSFPGVLRSFWREARVMTDGKELRAGPHEIFEPRWTHTVEFGEFGKLEAFVNGDAVAFAEMLGIRDRVKTTGRFAMRWPGHCEFWQKMSALGFLDESAPPDGSISPREFLRKHLEPRLQYGPTERDMALLRVEVIGKKDGARRARRWDLLDYRDLETGLMAMNRTVGYPASIAAQMILSGSISRRGVACAVKDIPRQPFFDALVQRGIRIAETELDPAKCRVPRTGKAKGRRQGLLG